MSRRLISTGSPFEKAAGFSRAVVDGDFCFVAGTTGYDYSTMIMPAGPALSLVGIVGNLFNVQYADPASASLQQDSIVQNGRTLRVGLSWKFLSK